MVHLTQAQLDSLYQIYLKWQNVSPMSNIMPEKFQIVESTTRYIGVWVGYPHNGNPGSLFIGVEPDGHAHS